MGDWISVKDRLPPDGHGTVCVLTECGQLFTAWASYWSGSRSDFACWSFPSDDQDGVEVTHWLALPELPVTQ